MKTSLPNGERLGGFHNVCFMVRNVEIFSLFFSPVLWRRAFRRVGRFFGAGKELPSIKELGLYAILSYGFVSNASYSICVGLAWFAASKKTGAIVLLWPPGFRLQRRVQEDRCGCPTVATGFQVSTVAAAAAVAGGLLAVVQSIVLLLQELSLGDCDGAALHCAAAVHVLDSS